ncbi:MAG: hypothetical protein ABEJ70_03480 [Halobacteriaceae archaeon]
MARVVELRRSTYAELVLAVIAVWGFGDAVSTLVAHAFTGDASAELNPWVRVLLGFGPLWLVVLKAAVVLYVGVVLLELESVVRRAPGWRHWLRFLVVSGVVVTALNLYVALA